MNGNELLNQLGDIDEKYLKEADPEETPSERAGSRPEKGGRLRRLGTFGAVLAAVLALSLGIRAWSLRDDPRLTPGSASAEAGMTEPGGTSAETGLPAPEGALAKLVWYSDQELLARADLIVLASVLFFEEDPAADERSILTLHPIRILKGEEAETDLLRVSLSEYPANSSVADMNFIMPELRRWRSAPERLLLPQEGIFLLTEVPKARQQNGIRYELHTGYGAILEAEEGTVHVHSFFTGFPESLTLAEAEKKISAALGSAAAPPKGGMGKEILYRGGDVVVREGNGSAAGLSGQTEAVLRYMTDRELFTEASLVVRARVKARRNIEIVNERTNTVTAACLLTLEPIRVLSGELETEGEITVFVNRNLGTSLSDLNAALRSAVVGKEGILMLRSIREGMPAYMAELADYTVGDSHRFAIWEQSSGSITAASGAFTGFARSWTLDRAEEKARTLLAEPESVPADFAFTLEHCYFGESERHDSCFFYDSLSGALFLPMQEAADGEARVIRHAVFFPDEEQMKLLCASLRQLKDLPEEAESPADAFGETHIIRISLTAEGKTQVLCYRGAGLSHTASQSDEEMLLAGVLWEIEHMFSQAAEKQDGFETAGRYSRVAWQACTAGLWPE